MTLFALQYFYLCQRGISTQNQMIYTINGSNYCVKMVCNSMITTPRRDKYPSCSAYGPSDVAVTVNIHAVFNLSLNRWQLTLLLNALQGISSLSIITVYCLVRSTLRHPLLSNPFQHKAIDEWMRLRDGKLYNATNWESSGWSHTLADYRDVLQHHYAAKQYLVHSIWGMHNWDPKRRMLKQLPTLNMTCSNWYQVRAQVDNIRSHFIQSARDNIAELYDLHLFESDIEH